jgi:hypothetical protein
VLVVPFDEEIVRVAWAPDQKRIAILDHQARLHVARVKAPGPTTITIDESMIR